jgi:hypothetical protein
MSRAFIVFVSDHRYRPRLNGGIPEPFIKNKKFFEKVRGRKGKKENADASSAAACLDPPSEACWRPGRRPSAPPCRWCPAARSRCSPAPPARF